MTSRKNWMGMLVMVLVFGITVVGCDLFEKEDFSGVIDGIWYHTDYHGNKYGDSITINGKIGTITSIDENTIFKTSPNTTPTFPDTPPGILHIGFIILKNINFIGVTSINENILYWSCEFMLLGGALVYGQWRETYISYDRRNGTMRVWTRGTPNTGTGTFWRFTK